MRTLNRLAQTMRAAVEPKRRAAWAASAFSRAPAPIRLAPWCIGAVILAGYANSFAGQFLFDDYSCIVENPHIRHLWPLWNVFISPRPDIAIAGRPVVSLTLALNYALGGLEVWGYHAVNLALHLASALTVFGLVRRTLGSARLRARYTPPEATGLSLAIALVWGLHPLVTESVTYIIQRTELLMALAGLLTLYSVSRGISAQRPSRWYGAAVLACALGMASKEVMAVTPILAGLYDRIFYATSWRALWRARRRLYLGLAGTWLILLGLLASDPRPVTAGTALPQASPWEYAMTQCGVLLHYLRLALWPHPLVVDYGDWPMARHLAEVWPQLLVIVGLLGVTAWALRRRPAAGFFGAWFFLILSPSSSVLPIVSEVAAERRMYLPLLAVIALLILGGWALLLRLIRDARLRRGVALGLTAGLLAILGTLTVRRNSEYRSERLMLEDVIAKRPANARAHYNLGIALAEAGQPPQAVEQFETALRLDPRYAEAHGNLGVVLARQGKFEEAIAHEREAVRLRPDLPQAHNNLGVSLAEQGNWDEAIRHYTEALRLDPGLRNARNNLAEALARKQHAR